MYLSEKNRLVSYREFCELLQNSGKRVWFDRLIDFYSAAGRGKHFDRVRNVLAAIADLSHFLDWAVGGGKSIDDRYGAEGIKRISSAISTNRIIDLE